MIMGMPASLKDALSMLDTHQSGQVIFDYDDQTINRDEFLNHLVTCESPVQVMLVSLIGSGQVVVYGHRRLTSAQAEN